MAGVVLVATSAIAQQVPTRALVEELRIDGNEHEWTSIRATIPLAGGNVLVAHGGDFALTIFTPAGAAVRKFARKGAGPGEVQSLNRVGLVGDTIWTGDGGQNRISFFGPDGTFGRSFPVAGKQDWTAIRPDVKMGFNRALPTVLGRDDVALSWPGTIVSRVTDGTIKAIPLIRTTWDGTFSRIVAELPIRLSQMEIKSGDRTIYASQPFRASPILETSRDGRHIAMVDVPEGANPVIRILRFNDRGDTVARQDVPFVPVEISRNVVDSVVRVIATGFKIADESAVRSAMNVPKHYYPVDKVLIASDGTLWLRAPVADGQRRWTLVSPAGKVIETLTTPATTDLQWIDGSIWGVSRDADDVPSVVRLRRK